MTATLTGEQAGNGTHEPTKKAPIALRWLEPGALARSQLLQDCFEEPSVRLDPGTRLGAYQIVRELARGGMGVVYLAQRADGQFEQQLAIKCVIGKRSAHRDALFRRERQVLAELTHPHIARLLDGGSTEDGTLWTAMELIDGLTLDHFLAAKPVALATRLELLCQVASAVSAAHANVLVHRDIKPANVMIDRNGYAKLLDFGIAAWAQAAADDAPEAFTPKWASPEQKAGQPVGTASDQYQLGLLLQHMLAQHIPSGERGAELQAILTRALSNEPTQRYDSVPDFANDVQRWLRGLPVRAYADNALYRLRAAVRRHPVQAAVWASLGVLIVCLLAWNDWRVRQQRDVAIVQTTRAEAEAESARAMLTFLGNDLLAQGDPIYGLGADVRLSDVLGYAKAQIPIRFANRPQVAQGLYRKLADSYVALGEFEPALALYARADSASDAAQIPSWHADRVWQQFALGDLAIRQAKFDLAKTHLQQGLTLLRQNPALSAADALWFEVSLVWVDFEQGQVATAEPALAELVLRWPKLAPKDQEGFHFARHYHALSLTELSRFEQAEPLYRALAHDLRARRGEEHAALAQLHRNYGAMLREAGRYAEAIKMLEPALVHIRKKLPEDHIEVHGLEVELGWSRVLSGDTDTGLALLEHGALGRERKLGLAHNRARSALIRLAQSYQRVGRHAEALVLLQRTCTATLKQFGDQHPQAIYCNAQLACAEFALAQKATARTRLAAAQALAAALPKTHVRRAEVLAVRLD
jgi:eukaryotic-like serine/threonine-protein kinase